MANTFCHVLNYISIASFMAILLEYVIAIRTGEIEVRAQEESCQYRGSPSKSKQFKSSYRAHSTYKSQCLKCQFQKEEGRGDRSLGKTIYCINMGT